MPSYSRHELKKLRQAAGEFARTARPGRTYYVIDTVHGGGEFVAEIQFKKKWGVGLMWGSYSPEKLFELRGGIYENRDDPAIRHLVTWAEDDEDRAKHTAQFLSGRGHHERLDQATRGTGFRSTW